MSRDNGAVMIDLGSQSVLVRILCAKDILYRFSVKKSYKCAGWMMKLHATMMKKV